nr:MAG: hypothetical protein 2 [Guangxi cystovirus 16]
MTNTDEWSSYIDDVRKRERDETLEKARSFDSVLMVTYSSELFEDEDLKPVEPKESTRDCISLACDTDVKCLLLNDSSEHVQFAMMIAAFPLAFERDIKFLSGLPGQEGSKVVSQIGGLDRVPYSRFRADLDSMKFMRSQMTEEELEVNASKLEHSKRGSDKSGMELIDFDSALSSLEEDDSEDVESEQDRS